MSPSPPVPSVPFHQIFYLLPTSLTDLVLSSFYLAQHVNYLNNLAVMEPIFHVRNRHRYLQVARPSTSTPWTGSPVIVPLHFTWYWEPALNEFIFKGQYCLRRVGPPLGCLSSVYMLFSTIMYSKTFRRWDVMCCSIIYFLSVYCFFFILSYSGLRLIISFGLDHLFLSSNTIQLSIILLKELQLKHHALDAFRELSAVLEEQLRDKANTKGQSVECHKYVNVLSYVQLCVSIHVTWLTRSQW